MTFVFGLLASLGTLGIVFGAFFLLFLFVYGALHDSPKERKDFIRNLLRDSWRNRYSRLLSGFLDWLDRSLAAREIKVRELEEDEAQERARSDNRKPWSYGLLDLCLALAIAYPLLSMIAIWIVTGDAGRIGPLEVFPPEANGWIRAATLGGLVVVAICLMFAMHAPARAKRAMRLVSLGLGREIADWVALALALAVVVALAFALAVAVALAFALAGAVALAGALAVALAGALAVAFAWEGARLAFERRSRAPAVVTAVFVLALLPLLAAVAVWAEDLDLRAATFMLFLGFLPILNAFADFASTGATRLFLRKALDTGSPVWTILDLVVGALIFLALGGAIVLTVAIVTWLGGPVLIDLQLLFADASVEGSLRHPESNYGWLYFMLLSTLIPTFAHLVLFLLSFATTQFRFVRRGIAGLLVQGQRGRKGAGNWGLLALSAAMASSVTLAIAIVWGLWEGATLIAPHLREGLLAIFESWARLLGVVP